MALRAGPAKEHAIAPLSRGLLRVNAQIANSATAAGEASRVEAVHTALGMQCTVLGRGLGHRWRHGRPERYELYRP